MYRLSLAYVFLRGVTMKVSKTMRQFIDYVNKLSNDPEIELFAMDVQVSTGQVDFKRQYIQAQWDLWREAQLVLFSQLEIECCSSACFNLQVRIIRSIAS